MTEVDLETEVAVLKQQVMDLMAQIAALAAPNGGGFLAEHAPGQFITEPKPITAFDVRKIGNVWKMYYPTGCLMCDGSAPTGLTPDADGYVTVQDGNVGIGITWKKDKETKEITDVVAVVNSVMSSTLTVTEGETSYEIAANIPIALKIGDEIRQVTSGFVSLTSDTGDAGKDNGVDDVSIEEYDESASDSDIEAKPVHAIKGWHDAEPSSSKLGTLLTGDSEDTSRQILVRNGKGGSAEFLPLGKIKTGSDVDDVSIEEHDGGTESDIKKEHAIKGWHDEEPSSSKLGTLLTGDSEDTSRQILVRNGKGGAAEFLPLGKLAKVASTGSYNDLTDQPTIPQPVQPNDGKLKVKFGNDEAVDKFSANQQGDSTLEFSKVASTGSYNDLTDQPTIPQPVQPNDGKLKVKFGNDEAVDKFSANQQGDSTLEFSKVASTGSYNDLTDQPTIPTHLSGTVKFVGEDGVIYDTTSHQLQIRVDSLDLATGVVTPGSWKMIAGGQAVAHA